MTQPANDSYDNVVPLFRNPQLHDEPLPVSIDDLAQATATFDRLERCIASLKPSWILADDVEWPIVSLQVQLPKTKQWLGHLEHISLANWPDARWARSLGSARAAAMRSLRTAARSLYSSAHELAPIEEPLATDVEELAKALEALRMLITDRYPETTPQP